MNLSAKTAVVIFSAALIALIGTDLTAFFLVKSALQVAVGNNQLETARQTMDKIDRLLHERFINIQSIANGENLKPILTAPSIPESISDLKKRMRKLTVLTGPWDTLEIVSEKGIILLSSDSKKEGHEIYEFPQAFTAFKEAAKGDTYFSDSLIASSSHRRTMLFSAPIRDENSSGNPVIGVVVGYFSWPAVSEILEDVEAYALLLNREGKVITDNTKYLPKGQTARSQSSIKVSERIMTASTGSSIQSAGTGLIPAETLTSVTLQRGFLSYRGSQWKLILEVPTAVAFGQATRTAISVALFFIPAILFMGYVILFLMKRFVITPIVKLTETTKIIAKGNLTQQIDVTSRDEIGDLANSFNQMISQLRESYDQLEEKVKERTGQLLKTNDELNKEIADRKRLEKTILQSEKMAAIGKLASGVAHEINNPLGIILGFAQILAKQIKSGDPFEIHVKSIERESLRCKTLVQDLLTFSRAGRAEKELMDLKVAIEEALSLVLAQSKFKNVELEKEIQEIPKIFGNQNQIQQVIVNLSNNAIDAMPKGGRLSLRVCKITFKNRPAVQIAVEDTGQGIPEELLSKIFDPFFTTKEVGKGTGLGLSLVYEIVEKHDGQIRVQSELGKGSVFLVTLPAA